VRRRGPSLDRALSSPVDCPNPRRNRRTRKGVRGKAQRRTALSCSRRANCTRCAHARRTNAPAVLPPLRQPPHSRGDDWADLLAEPERPSWAPHRAATAPLSVDATEPGDRPTRIPPLRKDPPLWQRGRPRALVALRAEAGPSSRPDSTALAAALGRPPHLYLVRGRPSATSRPRPTQSVPPNCREPPQS
jgi:hypothetical protein